MNVFNWIWLEYKFLIRQLIELTKDYYSRLGEIWLT